MKVTLKERIQWRKDQVQQLLSKGYQTNREIAAILQVSKSTVNKDILALRTEAKDNVRKYIDERLPEEYERIMVGLTSILREAWDTSSQADLDTREKLQALSLAKECYSMKLDLLTNATVLEDASNFIAKHKKTSIDKNPNEEEIKSNDKKKEESESTEERGDNTTTATSINNVNKVF